MEIKFDVYFKKNLGTLFKNNEVDLNGLHAHTNLQLALVDRLEINYKVDGAKYTDDVVITDATENLIQIPFKSDVMKAGQSEFELVAYMKNGDIKVSQTYTYNIEEGIGEGKQSGSGGSSDGHIHNNLTVLNTITQAKVNEWNNKADSTHSHSEYASKSHTHNANEIEGLENVNIDLSDYYTKSETYNRTEIDNKIANAGSGGSVDLSNYYTKSETDEVVNNKADKVHTHSQYLTEHQDISHKADKADTYTKNQTDNKIGNKTYRYLTQSEYNSLPNEEKNNENIVYFITDAKEDVFTLSLDGNKLSLLKNGISVSSVAIPTSSSEGSDIPDETPNPGEGGGNGGVDFVNYIYNSDTFVNPTTGNAALKTQYYTISTGVEKNVNNGVWELTVNELDSTKNIQIKHGFADGKVYYIQYKIKTNSPVSAGSSQKMEMVSASDNWNTVSYLYTDSSAHQGFIKVNTRAETSIGALIQIKEPMKINLTELYGSGNEPTKEECDAIFATYKSGLVG